MKFERLFSPKSVAIIGGGFWGSNVAKSCLNIGFEGPIWPVHPHSKPLAGMTSYPSIADLPGVPDAAYICVNRHQTIEVVRELAALGCGGAICFASGFSESTAEDDSAAELQAELIEAAGDMLVLGPNCYGFINYLDKFCLWPDLHGGQHRDSGVAIIAQSSNIALNLTMVESGLPLSHVFTVGNQAKVDMAELAVGLVQDPRVKAIGLHIEGMKDIRHFEVLAELAHRLGKPVVVLKVGVSEAARKQAVSHTASLAGNHAAASALFKRLGFAQVHSLPDLVDTLKLAYTSGHLKGAKISSMSCSGGEACLMSDLAENSSVTFPAFSDEVMQRLREVLGPLVALANPLDYHTFIWGNEEKTYQMLTAVAAGGHDVNLLILDYPQTHLDGIQAWQMVSDTIIRAAKDTGASFGVIASLHDNMRVEFAQQLIANGITPFAGIQEALTAIEALAGAQYQHPSPVLLGDTPAQTKRLEEFEAKSRLAQCGLCVPTSQRADSAELAAEAAAKIGFPVVVKGEGFAHKTEAGAVVLNLHTAEQVSAAAQAMPTQQFLVEAMVPDFVAELIVGVTIDPAHGYMLTLGAGGVLTEILQDTTSLLVPATRDDIRHSLGQLKVSKLLNGFRGKPAADLERIVDAVEAVQNFVIQHAGVVSEVEVNPLLVGRDFAVAADALIQGDFS